MPYFFQHDISQHSFVLSFEEAKHLTKVMRLKDGDLIWITDGKGTLAKATLTTVQKDVCEVEIVECAFIDDSLQKKSHLAVAPTKNSERMEWLVEKAVEIGVSTITFIICERSERKHIDLNRLSRIAIAALKQSQGVWLPMLKTIPFMQFITESKNLQYDKFIGYCDDKEEAIAFSAVKFQHKNAIFLIGPEGDFTPHEVTFAKENGYQQISLGERTLRTETAALFVGCCYVNR